MTTLSQQVQTDGRADYKEVFDAVYAGRLEVLIRRAHHDRDSFARLRRWSGCSWRLVYTIESATMKTPMLSVLNAIEPKDRAPAFKEDRDELLRMGLLIIAGQNGPRLLETGDHTCSFCGLGTEAGLEIVDAPGASICNECVARCAALLREIKP